MSKESTASALAYQMPTKDLLSVIAALEYAIRLTRNSEDIGQAEKDEILPGLVNIRQMYKTALDCEATILLLCSIR